VYQILMVYQISERFVGRTILPPIYYYKIKSPVNHRDFVTGSNSYYRRERAVLFRWAVIKIIIKLKMKKLLNL
jgi:hypothetical protein